MPSVSVHPSSMGVFTVRVRVYSLRNERKVREIDAMVDTGALLPVFPREFLKSLDVDLLETRTFTLANGHRIRRRLGQVGIEYEDHRAPTLVVVGAPGDAILLGALALEGLGYEADTVHKTLRPTTLYLLGLGPITHAEATSS